MRSKTSGNTPPIAKTPFALFALFAVFALSNPQKLQQISIFCSFCAFFMNTLSPAPRPNDIIANLPPAVRAKVHQWLLDGRPMGQISTDLAKPPPDGCSVDVSIATISRYRRRRLLALEVAEVDEIIAQFPDPRASLRNLLQQSALTTALDADLPPSTFQILARYYRVLRDDHFKQRLSEQRDQEIQLARDRLAHQRRVFEFNAARAALSALSELQQIANDPQMDDEQKVWEARKALFGALPEDQPQPKPLGQFIQ